MNPYQKRKAIYTMIEKCLEDVEKPYLSCSFGKDSILLLYFVRQIIKDIDVVYINSGCSFQEVYKYGDFIVLEWELNYKEIVQDIDYIELCKNIGLPHERETEEQNKAVRILKKDKFNDFVKKQGYDGLFWGLRAAESRGRKQLIKAKGYKFKDNNGLYRLSPIAYLSDNEVWELIDFFKIPYCSLYDKNDIFKRKDIRNSGWVSTDGDGKILHIKHYYPELYDKLEKEFPQIRRRL